MDGQLGVFLSICLVGLAFGSGSSRTSPPPKGSTPVTEERKAANTNLDPDEFFNWFHSVGGNKTRDSNQPTTTTNPPETQSSSAGEPVTSTDKPGATTREIPAPDAFFAWLDGLKPETTESGAQQTFTSPQTKLSDAPLPTNQNASSDTHFDLTTSIQDNTEAPTQATSQEHRTEFKEHPSTHKSVKDAMSTTSADPGMDEDLEWLRNMFPETEADNSPETETGEIQQTTTHKSSHTESPAVQENKQKHRQFDLPPPDKFYEWLNSIHANSKSESLNMDQSPSSSKISPDQSVFLTTKLIIILSIFGGVFGISLIIVSAYLIRRRKHPQKASSLDDTPVKPGSDIYFSGYTDVFHGIPTNNDIWKNLDMLSVNTPSVLPDNERKV